MTSLLLRTAIALFAQTSIAAAAVSLPAIFSDHAVLQADKDAKVWGWADAGERVRVTIAGKTVEAVAGADKMWSVQLPKLPAGGPFTLEVAGTNVVQVKDVLVGEVWLCAGQSNMAMQLKGLHGEVDRKSVV